VLAKQRIYKSENAEQLAAYEREYRQTDRGRAVRAAALERYRASNQERVRESARESAQRSRALHPELHRDRYAQDRAAYPEKVKARKLAEYAIRKGRLVRGPCEREGTDCSGEIHAHHDDYSQPLDVRWFCRRHHEEHHHGAA
jgi:hypothetical protein